MFSPPNLRNAPTAGHIAAGGGAGLVMIQTLSSSSRQKKLKLVSDHNVSFPTVLRANCHGTSGGGSLNSVTLRFCFSTDDFRSSVSDPQVLSRAFEILSMAGTTPLHRSHYHSQYKKDLLFWVLSLTSSKDPPFLLNT